MPQKHRLFIASFIAPELSGKIEGIISSFRHDCFHPVPLEKLHITYAFLGNRDEAEIPAIKTILPSLNEQLCGMSFCLGGIAAFEQHGSKSPLVLKLTLSKDISHFIDKVKMALSCTEARPFIPHITIGKIRKEYAGGAISGLEKCFGKIDINFPMPPAVLAKSITSEKGSVYSIIS